MWPKLVTHCKEVTKIGKEQVPWICALIPSECQQVHNNYNKRTHDSVAPDSLCVAWMNDGLARCECWSSQGTVDDLSVMQQQSVCGPTACRACSHAYTKASGLCHADYSC